MFNPNEIRRLEVEAALAELAAKQAGVRAKEAKLQAEHMMLMPPMPAVVPELHHTRKSPGSLVLTVALVAGAAALGWAFNRDVASSKAAQANVVHAE